MPNIFSTKVWVMIRLVFADTQNALNLSITLFVGLGNHRGNGVTPDNQNGLNLSSTMKNNKRPPYYLIRGFSKSRCNG